MGLAVNASTLGMLVSGLAVGYFSSSIDRRRGILISLALLSIPTALLALHQISRHSRFCVSLQGVFMAAAFTLTLAYLGEHYSAQDSASAFAAYITGNVASNLIGRLISAGVADHLGLAANFYVFALLNLAGAVLVFFTVGTTAPMTSVGPGRLAISPPGPCTCAIVRCARLRHRLLHPVRVHRHIHLRELRPGARPVRVGADDARPRLFRVSALDRHDAAGRAGRGPLRHAAHDVGRTCRAALGLPLLLLPSLAAVIVGLALVGVGTFFAQATATGFVSRAATADRGSASGIYLACYFFGGIAGSIVLGQLYDRIGWTACVAGIGLSLLIAALLAVLLKTPMTPEGMRHDA